VDRFICLPSNEAALGNWLMCTPLVVSEVGLVWCVCSGVFNPGNHVALSIENQLKSRLSEEFRASDVARDCQSLIGTMLQTSSSGDRWPLGLSVTIDPSAEAGKRGTGHGH
jgi:hypothetical protein